MWTSPSRTHLCNKPEFSAHPVSRTCRKLMFAARRRQRQNFCFRAAVVPTVAPGRSIPVEQRRASGGSGRKIRPCSDHWSDTKVVSVKFCKSVKVAFPMIGSM
jgi:hypothetical protein